MRVIAGKAKGLSIKAPKGLDTRPTSDKVREAIFSSLGDRVINANVLDLYAGSGALGIEAISRGAISATFVEHSKKAQNVIIENLKKVEFSELAKVYKEKAQSYFQRSKNERFDLIFIDAPYKIGLTKLGESISLALHILKKNGVIVVEHSYKEEVSKLFNCVKTKKYGQTGISYLEKS